MAIKVSQAVIDEFRKKGMAASIAKYKAGEGDAEFNEAIRRYYPAAAREMPKPPAKVTNVDVNPGTKVTEDANTTGPNGAKSSKFAGAKTSAKIQATARKRSGAKEDQSVWASHNAGQFLGRIGRNLNNWGGANRGNSKSAPKKATPVKKTAKKTNKIAL